MQARSTATEGTSSAYDERQEKWIELQATPALAAVLTAFVLLSLALPSVGTLASPSSDDDDKPSAERREEM